MASILLPILPGTLPVGYCFTNFQTLLVDFANNMQAVLANGRSYYNIGDTKPAPEFQAYPWLNTNDGRWYTYNGVWRTPNNYDINDRRIYMGTVTTLLTYDQGTAGPVTPTSGPMWVVDTLFDGRALIGAGVIPTSSPAATVGVGEIADNLGGSGEYKHSLTESEMPPHTHDFTVIANNAAATGTGELTGGEFNSPNDGHFDGTTENTGGNGATPPVVVPHNNMQPYVAVYIIKPSGRSFYAVP